MKPRPEATLQRKIQQQTNRPCVQRVGRRVVVDVPHRRPRQARVRAPRHGELVPARVRLRGRPAVFAQHDNGLRRACSRMRAVIYSGWVLFLISSGPTHVQCTPVGVHRTCGEPDEIGLTPMGVELNGTWRVPSTPGGFGMAWSTGMRYLLAKRER